MATTHTDTNVNQLIINKLTKQEYDNLSQVSETELYLVEEPLDSIVTQNSTNPVTSGAVYNAIQSSQQQHMQSDWNQLDNTALDYIKNKPDLSVYIKPETDAQTQETSVNIPNDTNVNGSITATSSISTSSRVIAQDFTINDPNYSATPVSVQSKLDEINSKADETTSFTEASTRTNIDSGDTVTTIWGKIKKWFSDLKTVAFTGSYTDLTNKPTIPDISTKVSKAGDTMTGNLQITKETGYVHTRLSSTACDGLSASLSITTSGGHGVYSEGYWNGESYTASGKWLVLRDSNNTVKLNGTLTCPNKTDTIATLSDIPTSLPAKGGTANNVSGVVAIANGGTNATTAADARTNLGIGNVGTLNYASNTTKYLRNDGTWQVPPSSAPAAGNININHYGGSSTITIQDSSCNYYGRAASGYICFTTSSAVNAGNNLFLLSKTSSHNICFIASSDDGGHIRILKIVGNSGIIQNVSALPAGKTFYAHFSFITT